MAKYKFQELSQPVNHQLTRTTRVIIIYENDTQDLWHKVYEAYNNNFQEPSQQVITNLPVLLLIKKRKK